MATEVEARFAADGPGPLRRLAAVPTLGPARLGPMRTAVETDRYVDTRDGRLAAAGWACRLREREGVLRVSLKGPPDDGPTDAGPTDAWRHRRPELEGPALEGIGTSDWPPSAARDRLVALAGPGPLIERLRLVQRRSEREATFDDGRRVGLLSLDEVSVERDGAEVGRLFVVELELDPTADERELDELAAALGAVDGLRAEPRTKLERALALGGRG